MKPRYTDTNKYPHGYVKSEATDIRKTFERVRKQLEHEREEQATKVKTLRPIAERGSAFPSSSPKSGTAGAGPFSSRGR